MNILTAEKCREQFEEWFAEYAGQTIEWVKGQRASDTLYKTGPEINGYWFAWQASREALEIALPVLEQQERGEPAWIEWSGKGKPAEANPKMIEVKFRDGDTATEIASLWRWPHHKNDSDIIAYRVVEQERERGEEE